MRTPRDKYHNDSVFKSIVDTMTAMIHQCHYTPSELREAAILASILYAEQQLNQPLLMTPDMEIAWDKMVEWATKRR